MAGCVGCEHFVAIILGKNTLPESTLEFLLGKTTELEMSGLLLQIAYRSTIKGLEAEYDLI